MLEATFKTKVVKDLRSLDKCWFISIQQVARIGDPDLVCVINSHPVLLELKRSVKEKPRQRQLMTLHEAQDAGAFSFVAYPENWSTLFSFLRYLSSLNIEYGEITEPCLKLPSLFSEIPSSKTH